MERNLAGTVAPTVDSITHAGGYSPGEGYFPLLPVPPDGGDEDETLVNYNVAGVRYGDEVVHPLAVDSNGYFVVGGGSLKTTTAVTRRLSRTRRGPTTRWRRTGPTSTPVRRRHV